MAITGQKLLAAGTATLIAEPVLALAHTGGVGVIVGLVVGAIAYNAVEDMERMTGKEEVSSLPDSQESVAEQQFAPVEEKHFSLAYRIFNGKSTRNVVSTNQENGSTPKKSETPAENGVVDLADDLQIDIDELVGKAKCVVGMRRSGKTTLGARIAEEMGRFYVPMFIPDLEGDYLSLADGALPRCVVAGHPDSYDPKARSLFAPTTAENAFDLGYDVLENGLQLLLNMESYETVDEACRIVVEIIEGIFAWVKANPTKRCPCEIYLDEAQRFLPEQLGDSIIKDKDILQDMLNVYMDIIAVGGKRGLTPTILTQRFAQVNKKIMAQSEVIFLMRQTMDNDLKRCMEYVKKSTATVEEISMFERGQGIYIGTDGTQFVTTFKKRRSDGNRSHSPKAAMAMRYAQMPRPQVVNSNASQLKRTPMPDIPEKETSVPVRKAEDKNGKAIAIWESLMERNEAKLRPFAEAMELKETKAYELLTELADAGLIEWERRKVKA
ncbi:MAG: hypothetical protein NVSMB38_43760 [Ktedonobacteraceae bacterium]